MWLDFEGICICLDNVRVTTLFDKFLVSVSARGPDSYNGIDLFEDFKTKEE